MLSDMAYESAESDGDLSPVVISGDVNFECNSRRSKPSSCIRIGEKSVHGISAISA